MLLAVFAMTRLLLITHNKQTHQVQSGNVLRCFLPVVPGIKEFCDFIESERAKVVNLLVNKYAAISPLLTKIESLIMGTSTGKAKRMAQFYAYWEHKICDSITKMVLQ